MKKAAADPTGSPGGLPYEDVHPGRTVIKRDGFGFHARFPRPRRLCQRSLEWARASTQSHSIEGQFLGVEHRESFFKGG
jgi:hypothetical protein